MEVSDDCSLLDMLICVLQEVQQGVVSKAAGALVRGASESVREYDKGPRTLLTPFLNLLLRQKKPFPGFKGKVAINL